MPRVNMFSNISLDGYFVDTNGDMSWAHAGRDDPEMGEFTSKNAQGGGALVFGRITYQMMEAFWPTPMAAQMMPEVAKGMNAARKYVFSHSLKSAGWANTVILDGDPAREIARLKKEGGDKGLTILGSGSIVKQLTAAGLIDDFQFLINPVVLGGGRTLFDGVPGRPGLTLENSRIFKNGKVFLHYRR
jgi:dihydrofolate reductase